MSSMADIHPAEGSDRVLGDLAMQKGGNFCYITLH